MDEPIERRSNRSRKPKIHFNKIVQSLGLLKPFNTLKKLFAIPKKPLKTTKGSTKVLPTTKSSKKPSETPLDPPDPPILDPIEELCSQTAKLDIKAKKKAKLDEIS